MGLALDALFGQIYMLQYGKLYVITLFHCCYQSYELSRKDRGKYHSYNAEQEEI